MNVPDLSSVSNVNTDLNSAPTTPVEDPNANSSSGVNESAEVQQSVSEDALNFYQLLNKVDGTANSAPGVASDSVGAAGSGFGANGHVEKDELFSLGDVDGNGELSDAEIEEMMNVLIETTDGTTNAYEMYSNFDQWDPDGSGRMGYDDWLENGGVDSLPAEVKGHLASINPGDAKYAGDNGADLFVDDLLSDDPTRQWLTETFLEGEEASEELLRQKAKEVFLDGVFSNPPGANGEFVPGEALGTEGASSAWSSHFGAEAGEVVAEEVAAEEIVAEDVTAEENLSEEALDELVDELVADELILEEPINQVSSEEAVVEVPAEEQLAA